MTAGEKAGDKSKKEGGRSMHLNRRIFASQKVIQADKIKDHLFSHIQYMVLTSIKKLSFIFLLTIATVSIFANEVYRENSKDTFSIVFKINENLLENFLIQRIFLPLKYIFDDEEIIYYDFRILGTKEIIFELLDSHDVSKAKNILNEILKESPKGISFSNNGVKFSLKINKSAKKRILSDMKEDSIEPTIKAIGHRLDEFGLSGYKVERQGLERIKVDIPGVAIEKEKERIIRLIGTQGVLKFMQIAKKGKSSLQSREDGNRYILLRDFHSNKKYLLYFSPIFILTSSLKCRVAFDHNNNPVVDFLFDDPIKSSFAYFTGSYIGKSIAIVVDNKVYSILKITKCICDGHGRISSNFTIQEAHDLSIVLSNILPLPISRVKPDVSYGNKMFNTDVSTENAANQKQIEKRQSTKSSPQVNGCKSEAFLSLQLSASEAFQEGKSQIALEKFKKAYSLCPKNDIKEVIELIKTPKEER